MRQTDQQIIAHCRRVKADLDARARGAGD